MALALLIVVAVAAAAPDAAARARKTIVVSVGQQILWTFKDDTIVRSSAVSTGREGFDTPVGSYAVLAKLPSESMEGVIDGEYYFVCD